MELMARRIVVKIGGSLIFTSNRESLETLFEEIRKISQDHTIIILSGGGKVADFVRDFDRNIGLSEKNAHFAAIGGMEITAQFFSDFLPEAELLDRIPDEKCLSSPSIFMPLNFFRREDPLPHSWDVTSDSIALYVAERIGADLLILLKNIDGLFSLEVEKGSLKAGRGEKTLLGEVGVRAMRNYDVVDGYFSRFPLSGLKDEFECWIINGNYPERVFELITKGRTKGTKLLLSGNL